MSETQPSADPRNDEAAEWLTRLNSRTVTRESLRDFRIWRQDPENARAYARLETMWGHAAALRHDPDISVALRQVRRRRRWTDRLSDLWRALWFRPILGLGVAVTAAAAVAFGVQVSGGATYETGVGEQRVLRLADGSQLRLDTDSKVRVRFSDTARAIRLERGQAMFDVAHDANRPFAVTADGTKVRALGTRFDVRRFKDGVVVTLIEGRVEVRATDNSAPKVWSMQAGQQLTTGATPLPPRPVDIAAATSWSSGRLVFRDMPLSKAVAEVNRYTPHKIEIASDRFAEVGVSGVFDSGDTEAFVLAVTALHPLERSEGRDGSIVLKDRPPS